MVLTSNLETLYLELEAIDLDLILKAQSSQVGCLPVLLKRREGQFRKISFCLDELKQASVSEAEQDAMLELQGRALLRNKRIVTLINSLYTLAKEEFLRLNASCAKVSPYGRRAVHFRRIRA